MLADGDGGGLRVHKDLEAGTLRSPWGTGIYNIRGSSGRGRDFRLELPTSQPQTSPQYLFSQERQAELDKQKENRIGNQTDLGLTPVPRIIHSRCSINIC